MLQAPVSLSISLGVKISHNKSKHIEINDTKVALIPNVLESIQSTKVKMKIADIAF